MLLVSSPSCGFPSFVCGAVKAYLIQSLWPRSRPKVSIGRNVKAPRCFRLASRQYRLANTYHANMVLSENAARLANYLPATGYALWTNADKALAVQAADRMAPPSRQLCRTASEITMSR